MINRIKLILIGPPLPTGKLAEARLNIVRALAAFSPDALSSIAYANQEIYLGLVVAGTAGLLLSFPIGMTIAGLLIIVAMSYYQTIHGYPNGGGSYIVARSNLGEFPGLIAGAALLIDYLLNAAVSLTAGVAAIASAFPALWSYRVPLALLILFLITIANLRGIQESGTYMAIPVYLFLITFLGMIGYGTIRAMIDGPGIMEQVAPEPIKPLSWILILHAFSAGCTALTGIEAISNGIPVFKPPEVENASRTLIVMAILMGVLFVGSIGLTQYMAVVANPHETILSALAHRILGNSPFYFIVQISTLLILSVAANTSFAGFPRLAAMLATDGYLPRQLTNLGDRLVFNNGIIILALAAASLIILFEGDTHLLVPLFAVGAFLAFTLSQAGMVIHWYKQKGNQWLTKSLINGIGAIATGSTLLVVAFSKFLEGAWVIAILLPALIYIFNKISTHYKYVSSQLSLKGLPPSIQPFPPLRVVIPVSGVHRGMFDAVNFARSISKNVIAVYIELTPGSGDKVKKQFMEWWPDVEFSIICSQYRSIIQPFLQFLDAIDKKSNDGQMAAVVMPEIIPAHWGQELLHNQTSLQIKAALLYGRRESGFQRVIIDVPFHLRR